MENIKNNNIEPVDGSLVVPKSEAGQVLKEHGYKVVNKGVDAFVSLKDINKIYPNGVQAVYDFNIDIKENDFIVLVGPSGCGKSTTLRMIAGLEDITSGYLYIDKVLSNYLASKDRDISMVFQSYALYPQMTVYDNIAFPLKSRKYRRPMMAKVNLAWSEVLKQLNNPSEFIKAIREANDKYLNFGTTYEYVATKLKISDLAARILCALEIKTPEQLEKVLPNGKTLHDDIINRARLERQTEMDNLTSKGLSINEKYEVLRDGQVVYHNVKLSKEEIRKKVFEAAEILDLGPYLDRRPKELSGGQMQRVALGRAIVRDAKLFLMDEPLSNLDAKLRVQMRSEIVRIHEQIGATTIYVTHDQTEAMTMATKIAVMSKGWVQQIGTPQEIYYNPKNIFVATFIGSPAMNIFDGEYDNGIITFKSGFKVKLSDGFVEKHNKFYEDKVKDIERMLEQADFKKMHALRIIDQVLFTGSEHSKPENVLMELESLLKNVKSFSQECQAKVNSYLEKYYTTDSKALVDDYNKAMVINAKLVLMKIKEVVSTIDDEYGKEALSLVDAQLEAYKDINTNSVSLPTYFGFVNAVKACTEYVQSLGAGNKVLLASLAKLDITEKLSHDSHVWLKAIRKPLLTFEKIASSDIGKLHNAQVFNKNEKVESETLYYQKQKNKKKKSKVKVNLNSVDIEFVNNLYEVATNLLAASKAALTGKHNIRIGIRPEDIHLNNEYNEANKSNPFVIKSDIVELLGSELLVHTDYADTKMIAKISTGTLIKPHTDVELTMNTDKILIFDETSGDTI